ncbi:phage tail tube protein [Actinomadura sp. WMMA1423]|uniref:phage tail tube protein n=1 Tax=Actinomadura sp. WMMA1423 TaxID=2591108 RepID=UPI0011477F40|nr:phage tail tube protein [Actinomadura sp. WMMA1423]
MGTRSGLDAQLGFAPEVTFGTGVTPTRFVEFDNEDMKFMPTWLEGEGLRAGRKFKRASRVSVSRKDVNGKVDIKVPNKGLGLLLKAMIGSSATATQIGSSDAYEQIHTPGDMFGKSLTVQVGRPEPGTGTVRPFTYTGCKVTQWEMTVQDGDHLKLSVTMDGRDEDTGTALATASYASGAELFNFSHATLRLGGTPATAGGATTITGGTAVAAVVNQIQLKGESPMAVDRYGVGNAGLKAEQLENDYPTVTGSLDAEFAKAELYDVYKAYQALALELTLEFGEADTGEPFHLSFIAPAIKFKESGPSVDGPGLVKASVDFEVYDNGVDPAYQFRYVSTDTTL